MTNSYKDTPQNEVEYQKMIELMDGCGEKIDVYCDLYGDNGKYSCNYDYCPLRRVYLSQARDQIESQSV